MNKRFGVRHILYAASLLSLFFFQNCSSTPDSSLTSASSSFQETIAFAYKAIPDTIAYMSCSNVSATYDSRAYFSFRMGSYNSNTGGLQMTPNFLAATQFYTPTNRAETLSQSVYNSGIRLNFSIRSASNYQSLWGSTSPTQGLDMDVFLPQLDSSIVAGPFAAQTSTTTKVNYFPGNASNRLMEASLRFFDSETDATNTRNQVGNGSSYLVAGYSSTASATDTQLRSPLDFLAMVANSNSTTYPSSANTGNTAYGVAYQMNFSLPTGYSAGDRRVISPSIGITEMNLETRLTQPSTWNCSTAYQFMIVRPEDVASGSVSCATTIDNTNSATQVAELTAIRRVLRVEDWFVDLNHHCVVPKNGGDVCYGSAIDSPVSGTVAPYVQYGVTACKDSATTLCPHFVSVCVRQ